MEPLLKTLIPSLVEDGIFGDAKYVELLPDQTTEVGAQFASTLAFFNVTVRVSSGEEVIGIVVKLPISDPLLRVARNCDTMFHNEVTMYKEVLPHFFAGGQFYPKMYYGIATMGMHSDKDVLILENLKYKNFELSRQKVFLNFDHVTLAIKRIAKFHSMSYFFKHQDKNKFLQVTKQLKEITIPESQLENIEAIHFACIKRGMEPLLKKCIDVDILNECINLVKNPIKTRKLISNPEEPFAVICHGDFCNNNLLYKYDELGKPTDCALFDFQLSQYASPAIDLFFFLYMHTNKLFRDEYWDDILKIYWDTLRNSLPNEIEIPCFDDYLKHFGKRAIYGYIICCWFLPAMIDHNPATKDDYKTLSLEEKIGRFTAIAGDEGEQVISDVVLHMLNKNSIKDFIQFCTEQVN